MLVLVVVLLHLLQAPKQGGFREAGNVVVVRVAREPVQVPAEAAAPAVEAERAVPAVAVVGRAHVDPAAHPVRDGVRDAAGVHIDHPADGPGAVHERPGALRDFDSLCDEGVHPDDVVGARHRDVQGVDAVFHDPHARPSESPDDGPPDGGAERGVVHPGFVADRRPDVLGRLALEVLPGDDIADLRESLAGEGVPDDEDLLEVAVSMIVPMGVIAVVLRVERHGEADCGRRHQSGAATAAVASPTPERASAAGRRGGGHRGVPRIRLAASRPAEA